MIASLLVALSVAAAPAWPGLYGFEEFAPPNQTWGYALTIAASGKAGRLKVDGFQTHLDLDVAVKASAAEAVVTLRKHREPGMPAVYKPGDVLFTLVRGAKGKLTTRWGAMEPNLVGTKGTASFRRL